MKKQEKSIGPKEPMLITHLSKKQTLLFSTYLLIPSEYNLLLLIFYLIL